MENDDFQVKSSQNPKLISVLAYLTILGWVIALLMNDPKTKLGSFHIRQALGVFCLGVASSFIGSVPFVGTPAILFGFLLTAVLWIVGFASAVKGEARLVPILGEKFQEWFEGL